MEATEAIADYGCPTWCIEKHDLVDELVHRATESERIPAREGDIGIDVTVHVLRRHGEDDRIILCDEGPDVEMRVFRFHRGVDEVIFGARTGLGHVTPPA